MKPLLFFIAINLGLAALAMWNDKPIDALYFMAHAVLIALAIIWDALRQISYEIRASRPHVEFYPPQKRNAGPDRPEDFA